MSEQDTQTVERVASDCPWGCKAKHGLTKGQRDMHGDLNQNYAVWCDHARITAADKVRAFELWNTRPAMPDTTAQAATIKTLVEVAKKVPERWAWGIGSQRGHRVCQDCGAVGVYNSWDSPLPHKQRCNYALAQAAAKESQ